MTNTPDLVSIKTTKSRGSYRSSIDAADTKVVTHIMSNDPQINPKITFFTILWNYGLNKNEMRY